jgi:hypothetical protein
VRVTGWGERTSSDGRAASSDPRQTTRALEHQCKTSRRTHCTCRVRTSSIASLRYRIARPGARGASALLNTGRLAGTG